MPCLFFPPHSCLMAFEPIWYFTASDVLSSTVSLGTAWEGIFSGCKGWFDQNHITLLLKEKNGEESAVTTKSGSGSDSKKQFADNDVSPIYTI